MLLLLILKIVGGDFSVVIIHYLYDFESKSIFHDSLETNYYQN